MELSVTMMSLNDVSSQGQIFDALATKNLLMLTLYFLNSFVIIR